MAKHCDVCNQSYPETEDRCPHCAAAEKAAGRLPHGEDVPGTSTSSNVSFGKGAFETVYRRAGAAK